MYASERLPRGRKNSEQSALSMPDTCGAFYVERAFAHPSLRVRHDIVPDPSQSRATDVARLPKTRIVILGGGFAGVVTDCLHRT
jgi:hypothetical protein